MTMLRSLTHQEARERASVIDVESYLLDLDLTGLRDGPTLRAVSTIRFSCRETGRRTFVDCAADVSSAVLNGRALASSAIGDARIELTNLATDNVLVVESVQNSTNQSTGVQRSVDPADGKVYVWMSFEPDDARRVWACFDQPDLKAPHTFVVTAPEDWIVTSNSDSPLVEAVEGGRRWTYPATPPLSTYVPVVNAGPFYELRSTRGGYDLGLYARQSLAPFLDRDADELFDLTARGLAFFGEQFALPFPQRTYDQVFAPDMGGAMENYGCVTWSDVFIYRSTPSPEERGTRAAILLHEMAHMWFGDIVTMTWWNDLWLNEAFAEWACYWAAASATEFTDAWAVFLAGTKRFAYPVDRGPTSHPIRQAAGDVAEATAGFDDITYMKGASVLKQLVAYLGEEAFVAGLRTYFARYAWGNAALNDLMRELGQASGRDLGAWTEAWLDTAGTDILRLEQSDERGLVLHASGPNGEAPRTHRVAIGVYVAEEGGDLVRRDLLALEIDEPETPVGDMATPNALVLANDDDLTFATVRPDEASLQLLVEGAARLPYATSRAVAVVTVWDLLVNGGTPASQFVSCATAVLVEETVDSLVEPFLQLAVEAAERWSSDHARDALLAAVAEVCLGLAQQGGSRRMMALRALARTAVTPQQIEALTAMTAGDSDLTWRALTRLASLDRLDPDAVDAVRRTDSDPDAWVRALAVESAQPSATAKQRAWTTVMEGNQVPLGSMDVVATAFWQPAQAKVLAPFSERYLAALPGLGASGMIPAMVRANSMFPVFGTDDGFVDEVVAGTENADISPVVASRVVERADQLSRMLRARAAH